jgi:hypothetical protein
VLKGKCGRRQGGSRAGGAWRQARDGRTGQGRVTEKGWEHGATPPSTPIRSTHVRAAQEVQACKSRIKDGKEQQTGPQARPKSSWKSRKHNQGLSGREAQRQTKRAEKRARDRHAATQRGDPSLREQQQCPRALSRCRRAAIMLRQHAALSHAHLACQHVCVVQRLVAPPVVVFRAQIYCCRLVGRLLAPTRASADFLARLSWRALHRQGLRAMQLLTLPHGRSPTRPVPALSTGGGDVPAAYDHKHGMSSARDGARHSRCATASLPPAGLGLATQPSRLRGQVPGYEHPRRQHSPGALSGWVPSPPAVSCIRIPPWRRAHERFVHELFASN